MSGMRKSIGKDSPVNVVELDLPSGFPAGLFEAEAEPADAGADFSNGIVIVQLPKVVGFSKSSASAGAAELGRGATTDFCSGAVLERRLYWRL